MGNGDGEERDGVEATQAERQRLQNMYEIKLAQALHREKTIMKEQYEAQLNDQLRLLKQESQQVVLLRQDELRLEFEVKEHELRNEIRAEMRSEREIKMRNKLQNKLEKQLSEEITE